MAYDSLLKLPTDLWHVNDAGFSLTGLLQVVSTSSHKSANEKLQQARF